MKLFKSHLKVQKNGPKGVSLAHLSSIELAKCWTRSIMSPCKPNLTHSSGLSKGFIDNMTVFKKLNPRLGWICLSV